MHKKFLFFLIKQLNIYKMQVKNLESRKFADDLIQLNE